MDFVHIGYGWDVLPLYLYNKQQAYETDGFPSDWLPDADFRMQKKR